jgi:hypothetical protein
MGASCLLAPSEIAALNELFYRMLEASDQPVRAKSTSIEYAENRSSPITTYKATPPPL